MLGGDGVVIYGPTATGVEREMSLSWDMPNFDEQLVQALQRQNANKQIVVLFDGADQTYRKEENIPKLSPIDRPRFVKRKLELAFPAYPIRASVEIKPTKAKAKAGEMPSYLFVALPETDQVDRVGKAIFESGVPVAGFGLLPAESAGLVPTLAGKVFDSMGGQGGKAPSRWSVIIGQHETGGLRQVVVKDGNLALTRLTPTSEAGITGAAWAEEVTREFRATMTYISRFGYNQDDGIDVIIICDDVSRQFFSPADLGLERYRCVTVADALKHIGAKSFGLEKTNYADAVHAAWSAKKRALRLPIRVPSIASIMAPRLAAQGAAVLLFFTALALVYLTFSTLQQTYIIDQDIQQRQSQKSMLERELAEESKIFDTLPVDAKLLKGTLSVKKMLDMNTIPVKAVLQRLKSAMPPDVQITKLNYEHAPGASLVLDKSTQLRPPVGLLASNEPQPSERGLIKMDFTFGIPGNLTLEERVNAAEALQKKLLEAFPNWSVTITSQFGKVERSGSFTGTLTGDSDTAEKKSDTATISMKGAPL